MYSFFVLHLIYVASKFQAKMMKECNEIFPTRFAESYATVLSMLVVRLTSDG